MDGSVVEQQGQKSIFVTFYVERPLFEQEFVVPYSESGQPGAPVGSTFKPSTILEVQQGILLDIDAARKLRDQLNTVLPEE